MGKTGGKGTDETTASPTADDKKKDGKGTDETTASPAENDKKDGKGTDETTASPTVDDKNKDGKGVDTTAPPPTESREQTRNKVGKGTYTTTKTPVDYESCNVDFDMDVILVVDTSCMLITEQDHTAQQELVSNIVRKIKSENDTQPRLSYFTCDGSVDSENWMQVSLSDDMLSMSELYDMIANTARSQSQRTRTGDCVVEAMKEFTDESVPLNLLNLKLKIVLVSSCVENFSDMNICNLDSELSDMGIQVIVVNVGTNVDGSVNDCLNGGEPSMLYEFPDLDKTKDVSAECLELQEEVCSRPTDNPTTDPTANPTQFPTPSPTPNPTNNPTPQPTEIPTANPVFTSTQADLSPAPAFVTVESTTPMPTKKYRFYPTKYFRSDWETVGKKKSKKGKYDDDKNPGREVRGRWLVTNRKGWYITPTIRRLAK